MFVKIMVMTLLVIFIFTMIFWFISYKSMSENENLSSYECGFDLISYARNLFSYRFFLISILFIIFDVEIALMVPIPYFSKNSIGGAFLLFLLILIMGLLYEYNYGMLDWI